MYMYICIYIYRERDTFIYIYIYIYIYVAVQVVVAAVMSGQRWSAIVVAARAMVLVFSLMGNYFGVRNYM